VTVADNNQELVFSRTFDAPRESVFRAFTKPELVARWWAPDDERVDVEVLEPRAGGSWRYVNTEADGQRYVFHGVFHSVEPDRIVHTFEYSGMAGVVLLETVTLEDLGDGRTRLTDSSVFPTADARAGMTGDGSGGAMDRLEALLKSL
jgi:uncharacterized protein YndB with AHSA1/START domain